MAYDFDFAKLFAQFQYVKNTITSGDITMKGGQFGVSVPVGGGSLLASYGHTRSSGASEGRRNSWALGYDYQLSKRTDVYAAYYSDRLTDLSRGDTVGVGMRTRFKWCSAVVSKQRAFPLLFFSQSHRYRLLMTSGKKQLALAERELR